MLTDLTDVTDHLLADLIDRLLTNVTDRLLTNLIEIIHRLHSDKSRLTDRTN
jgi:hypothetical protein